MASGSEGLTATRTASQIVEDVTAGSSVLVTGLPGSGRTTLLERVAEGLSDAGVTVVRLRGAGAKAGPLSSLALDGVLLDDGKTLLPMNAMASARAMAALASLVDRRASALVVDEADALDRASAEVIAAVRVRKQVPLVLAGPCEVEATGPLAGLVAAACPGVTVALGGMPFGDVTQMVTAALDGKVSARAMSRIAALSGGLPGLVQALVRLGRRNGHLVLRGDEWRLEGALCDESLGMTLIPFLSGLESGEIDDLTALARSELTPREEALAMVGPARLDHLVRRGLVCVDRHRPEADVSVFPPALAAFLRCGDGEGERENPPGELTAEGWLSQVTGAQAILISSQIVDHWQVECARWWARWKGEKVLRNAVPLVFTFLTGIVDDQKVVEVFEKTVRDDDSELLGHFLMLQAAFRATWHNDFPGAIAELERWRRELPRFETALHGFENHLSLICDHVPDYGPVEPVLGGSGLLRLAQAEALIAQGDFVDASKLLSSLDLADPPVVDISQILKNLVLVLCGKVAEGVEGAVRGLREAVDALSPSLIPGHAYVAALGMTFLGRFEALESIFEIVGHLVEVNLLRGYYKRGLFLLGAYVVDWEGRPTYASTLVAEAKSLGGGNGPFPGMVAKADLLLSSSTTGEQMWDEVDALVERGYVVNAVFIAIVAVEKSPQASRAGRVIALAGRTESVLLRALGRYMEALVAKDLTGFGDIVATLQEVGGPVLAMRARISWALLLREKGDMAGWLEQAEAAWQESTLIARSCQGMFVRLTKAVGLTNRESLVAAHAAQGRSTPMIATDIGVSPRTVESQLQSVYKKTGVASREELRHLLKTWFVL